MSLTHKKRRTLPESDEQVQRDTLGNDKLTQADIESMANIDKLTQQTYDSFTPNNTHCELHEEVAWMHRVEMCKIPSSRWRMTIIVSVGRFLLGGSGRLRKLNAFKTETSDGR